MGLFWEVVVVGDLWKIEKEKSEKPMEERVEREMRNRKQRPEVSPKNSEHPGNSSQKSCWKKVS